MTSKEAILQVRSRIIELKRLMDGRPTFIIRKNLEINEKVLKVLEENNK